MDPPDKGRKRGRLTRARGPGNENDAMRFLKNAHDIFLIPGNQPKFSHGQRLGFFVEQAQTDALAVEGGEGGNPYIQIALSLGEGNSSALRPPFLGDVDGAHDLDPGNDRVLKTAQVVRDPHRHQLAVDPVADLEGFLMGLEMDIGRPVHDGPLNDFVDEADNGRILVLQIILGILFPIKVEVRIIQAVRPNPEIFGNGPGDLLGGAQAPDGFFSGNGENPSAHAF